MKTVYKIATIVTLFFSGSLMAQNPDQNPNYKESESKYLEQAVELTKSQGQTIQDTYEAYDWTENKLNEKNARIQRRHERRLMRHQPSSICQPYYSNGYGNNGYGNNGYYNSNYNNGYNNSYNNGYGTNYPNSINSWGSTILGTAILGTTLYYLFN